MMQAFVKRRKVVSGDTEAQMYIPWLSPSEVLATNYCVCSVCVCECVRECVCTALSGIYYSGPSW